MSQTSDLRISNKGHLYGSLKRSTRRNFKRWTHRRIRRTFSVKAALQEYEPTRGEALFEVQQALLSIMSNRITNKE